jgi:D-alanyl-D-alanine carboxypeptidase
MPQPRTAAVAICTTLVALSVSASAGATSTSFHGAISPLSPELRRTMTGRSWHVGCPVSLNELRLIRATHWGFDGRVHQGRLVVNQDVSSAVVGVLRRLYRDHVAIHRMVLIDNYGASDYRSIEADNTSAFNCRYVDGTTRWSNHAYGKAIDLNPIENPYVGSSGTTSHPASVPYLNRSRARKGMALEGGALVAAFDAAGWGWGGRWSGAKDYQHFSADGT